MTAVKLELLGRLATITIDRPEVRNAVDRRTAEELAAAIDAVEAREDVWVMIIRGAGGTFSTGMDLKAFTATGERPVSGRGLFGIVGRPPEKPAIAAVEGPCLGGGFEIALACDLIVAATDASFGLPESRRGLLAAAGGLVRLPRRIPRNLALEVAIAGTTLGAERAAALGLVSRVVGSGEAQAAAIGLAEAIAESAPLAVRASKRLIQVAEDLAEEDAFAAQEQLVRTIRRSRDAREGTSAFLEKRAPRWQAR